MCECCETIEELKEIENRQEKIPNVTHKLVARLTSLSERKGLNKPCGIIDFEWFDLNYCPKCRTKTSRKLAEDGRK